VNQILVVVVICALIGGLAALAGYAIDKFRAGKPKPAPTWPRLLGVFAAVGALGIMRAFHQSTEAASVDQQLDAVPAFQVIHQYYPVVYKQMLDKLHATNLTEGNSVAVENTIRPLLSKLTIQQMAYASSDDVAAEFTIVADEASTVRDVSPENCMEVLNGNGQVGFDTDKVFTGEEKSADLAETTRMLQQTATNPLPPAAPLSQAQAQHLARAAFSKLDAADRAALTPVLQSSRQPAGDAEQRAYCDFTIAMFRATASLPPDQQRAAYSTFVASAANSQN
jgi:hypothetical protein